MEYELPDAGSVGISVFDQTGKLVSVEDLGIQQPGLQRYVWNGLSIDNKPLPVGLYHCQVQFKALRFYEKILLIK